MKKTLWRTLRMALKSGETFAEKEISLEKGERIVAAVATNQAAGQLVNLGLFENGQEVATPMDLSFWKRSNAGQYLDGFVPINYNGGATVSVRIATAKPLASGSDLEVEVAFAIIQETAAC